MRKLNGKSILLWAIALVITMTAAVYQRKTGPTYPIGEKINLAGKSITVTLDRSHAGPGDQEVIVAIEDRSVTGELHWRRYPTRDEFTAIPMKRKEERLVAYLPHQPPAGKLEYQIHLRSGDETVIVPAEGTVVTRFRGDVPAFVIIPHILFMFLAMAYSNRAGIEALSGRSRLRYYTFVTVLLLFVGGMILGPIVQKYAFGAFWTGFPFGHDLTDNKTLVAFLGWVIALLKVRRNPNARVWIVGAALLTLIVYLIPHSLLGSELKYE
ncbi:MAG: hypothetical protein JSV84_01210 [Gemmatimonadota bacterium]|nr:MAG: hypothetical protein JSV84_01210 [Gemmatimonadota bacterium]